MQQLKRWIKARSNFLTVIVALGVFGCSKTPKHVYVDLTKIIKSHEVEIDASKYLSVGPQWRAGSKQFIIKSLPEKKYFSEVDQKRADLRSKIYTTSLESKMNELLADLTRLGLSDVKKYERDHLDDIRNKKKLELDSIYNNLRSIFLHYTEPLAKRHYRLAVISGYPDSDPYSIHVPDKSDFEKYRLYEEAKRLRGEIKELDRAFFEEFEKLLVQAEASNEKQLQELAKRVKLLNDEAKQKAIEEAKKLLESSDHIASKVERKIGFSLPKVKQKGVKFNKISPAAGSFSMKPERYIVNNEENLRLELGLWAKLHGYVLTKDRLNGNDLTKDFIKWRNQYELVP